MYFPHTFPNFHTRAPSMFNVKTVRGAQVIDISGSSSPAPSPKRTNPLQQQRTNARRRQSGCLRRSVRFQGRRARGGGEPLVIINIRRVAHRPAAKENWFSYRRAATISKTFVMLIFFVECFGHTCERSAALGDWWAAERRVHWPRAGSPNPSNDRCSAWEPQGSNHLKGRAGGGVDWMVAWPWFCLLPHNTLALAEKKSRFEARTVPF